MVSKVQKWGNSQGLRIARSILADAHLAVGDEVDLAVRNGAILVLPVRRVRGRVSLRNLVDRIPKDYRTKEVSWGPPAGKEAW